MQKFRFNDERDFCLLQECLANRVYAVPNGQGWKRIVQILNDAHRDLYLTLISVRTVRDRINLMLDQFGLQTKANLASSGIVEEQTEKEKLLEELQEQKDSATQRKNGSQTYKELAIEIRDRAMEGRYCAPEGEEDTADQPQERSPKSAMPGKKGKKRQADQMVLDYLIEKDANRKLERQQEHEARMEELRIRKEEMEANREERTAMITALQELVKKLN